MSKTMLRGKRLLAGVAAGALGAGLLVGLGAAPANAVTTVADTGVLAPNAATQNYTATTLAGGGTAVTNGTVIAGSLVTLRVQLSDDSNAAVTFTVTPNTGAAPALVDPRTTANTGAGNTGTVTVNANVGTITTVNPDPAPARAGTTTGSVSFLAGAAGTVYTVAFSTGTNATLTAVPFTVNPGGLTRPAASRVAGTYAAQQIRLNGTFPAANANLNYNVCLIAYPGSVAVDGGEGFTPGAEVNGANVTATQATLNLGFPNGVGNAVAGTYTLGVYARGTQGGAAVCNAATGGTPNGGRANAGSILLATFTQVYGGPVAAIAQTPASISLASGGAIQTVTVTATDAAGRATLSAPGDAITSVTADAAVATVPGTPIQPNALLGTMTYDVTAQAAGATTVSAVPQNLALAPATSSVGVAQASNTLASTTIGISGQNITETAASNPPSDRTFQVGLGASPLRFNISGLLPGGSYTTIVVGGTPTNSTIVADANGNATLAVTPNATAAGSVVTVTVRGLGAPGLVVGAGAGQAKRATVTYAAGVQAFQTPANGALIWSAASAASDVTFTVADQYGDPGAGTAVQVRTGSAGGPVVGSGITNVAGVATIQVTAPAAGQQVFFATGTLVTGVAIAPIQFTVTTATPAIAITGGVSNATTTVERDVPAGGIVQSSNVFGDSPFEATEVIVRVTAGGAPVSGSDVDFSSTEGVWFLTTNPNNAAAGSVPWNAGTATATVTPSLAGEARVWVYATRTGVQTITATVGGVSATGSFTVGTFAAAARNIAVTAPTEIRQGESGVVTLRVTDEFGNPVSVINAPGIPLRIADASIGTFGDGNRQIQVLTDANGEAQVTVRSTSTGKMEFVVGQSGFAQFGAQADRTTAAVGTNDAQGFAASNAPQRVEIEVKAGPEPPAGESIVISGARDGNRIEVVGDTRGVPAGTVVRPWLRFPGQTGWTEGTAQRSVTIVEGERGEFSWGRNTGKRTAVQFRGPDGLVSNSVIIPAK